VWDALFNILADARDLAHARAIAAEALAAIEDDGDAE
jgi:hypothetical protein